MLKVTIWPLTSGRQIKLPVDGYSNMRLAISYNGLMQVHPSGVWSATLAKKLSV